MYCKSLPIISILILLLSGCFSPSRPLFHLSETKNDYQKISKLRIGNESLFAVIDSHYSIYDYVQFRIEIFNELTDDLLLYINSDEIWIETCGSNRVYLKEYLILENGVDSEPVIIRSQNSLSLLLKISQPDCLPYNVPNERFEFTANLAGLRLINRSDEKISLFNSIEIFASSLK